MKFKRICKWIFLFVAVVNFCCMTCISLSGCSTKQEYAQQLIAAIEADDMEELQRLIDKGGDLNAKPYVIELDVENHTPVSVAVYKKNFEAVKMLVEAGADVNISGSNGWTPLHRSLMFKGNYEIAYYLIENGANVYARDNGGDAAINYLLNSHLFCSNEGNEEGVQFLQFLLENKGVPLTYSSKGHIFFDACYNDKGIGFVEYFLNNYEIDINMRDVNGGETPLMCTTYRNAEQICQLLLERGADKTLTNDKGQTAYDIAIEIGNCDEVAALVKIS